MSRVYRFGYEDWSGGWDAYLAGYPRNANPYLWRSYNSQRWGKGHRDAERYAGAMPKSLAWRMRVFHKSVQEE